MSPPLVILDADDSERMARLHARAFIASWSRADFEALMATPHRLALGIERPDGELAAVCLAQTAADEIEIVTLATSPADRRRGLARHLLQALLSRAGERGAARVLLDVASDNLPAQALYRGLGFEEDGVRTNYYGPGRHAHLLSRQLGI